MSSVFSNNLHPKSIYCPPVCVLLIYSNTVYPGIVNSSYSDGLVIYFTSRLDDNNDTFGPSKFALFIN